MIAVKPEPAAATIKRQEGGGLPTNIFAGLSFPEVPTHAIQPPTYESVTEAKDSSNAESSILANVVEVKQTVPKEESPFVKPAAHSALSLASLYTTNDSEEVGAYPVLPASYVSATYDNARLDYQAEESGRISESSNMQMPVEYVNLGSSCPPEEVAAVENCLVTDLVAENSRLCSELADLKKSLGERYPSTMNPLAPPIVAPSSSESARLQQEGMIRGEVDGENHGLLQASGDRTKDGLKYVCCGTCRTWLSAPVTAVYVKCPQCEAVNFSKLQVMTSGSAKYAHKQRMICSVVLFALNLIPISTFHRRPHHLKTL